MSFNNLGLPQNLIEFLAKQNFEEAYPIQKEVIPAIFEKRDVLGIAQTGSGKTAAYVLPILTNLKIERNIKNRYITALVLVPTRELAVQVNEVVETFAAAFTERIKSMAVFGGVSINPQMMKMQGVSILVATPGRLIELVENNAVHLSEIEILVLDEADKMLSLGFEAEMKKIFNLLPKKRQNLLFSATLSTEIGEINELLLKDPLVIKIEEDDNKELDLINQTAYFVEEGRKGPLLRFLIKEQNLQQVLVFASSIKRVDNIANKLRLNGIDAKSIHGEKTQGVRTDLLTKFKYRKLRVLVATDLLARGIDIDSLDCVINYELPRSPKDFIHRVGRTGRAEKKGKAFSFVNPNEEAHFKVIQKKMRKVVDIIDCKNLKF